MANAATGFLGKGVAGLNDSRETQGRDAFVVPAEE
jgi:hypothetical protein